MGVGEDKPQSADRSGKQSMQGDSKMRHLRKDKTR